MALDFALAHKDFEKGLNARAFFKVNDHSLGEDLVQDTFLKTWNYLLKGGKIDLMKAFLYHILNNLIIDQYRKHKTTSLDSLLEKGLEPSIDNNSRMLNILDGRNAIDLISHLPISYQKVMSMKYIEDLSLEEMSILTKQSKNSLAVKLHRGLEKLKKVYLHN
ncbi:MAG: RNA polymerase sigma factor [Patescibacteria group bacterium]